MTERNPRQKPRSPQPRPRPRSAGDSTRSAGSSRSGSGRPPVRRSAPRPRPGQPRRSGGRAGRWLRNLMLFALLCLVAVAFTGCVAYQSISKDLPNPDIRQAKGRDQSTVITDADGKTLARLFAEQNRQDVKLAEMPQQLRKAVIDTEDQRFYEHQGVDPAGIARALVVDAIKGEKAQGGSTITQQYVKQAFVTSEKTLRRKIQEAILAQKVEQRYSKNEILELYLNTIYFGHGAYGVEAASRAYFGTSVTKLTLPQCAMIAGVIKSPGRYSPYLDKEAAKRRRDTVLFQMRDQGDITAAQYAQAVATPVKVSGLKAPSKRAPYFVEWVKENLVSKFGKQAVYRGGLRVKTTLDPVAQAAAEKAVSSILNQKGDPSAALIAIKPKTGEVVAMVGGRDFETQQYNVAVQGRRQPGSSFKPFVLATALSSGVSPEKAFYAGSKTFDVNGQPWKVSGHGSGKMRLRSATEDSVNSVFAQLILDVGADEVVNTAEKLGLHKGINPVPAIALGGLSDGVSPLEMARAYSSFANGGMRPDPYGVATVTDPSGKKMLTGKPVMTRALDPAVAYLTTDILSGVMKRGTGTAARIGRPAAGKTGTTQQYRDAWFVGYTPDLVTAVWVGYPDSQREMKSVHGRAVTGGSFPAQIWASFMREALKNTPSSNFTRPSGLSNVKICTESGGSATKFCPKTTSGLFLSDYRPKPCQIHTAPVEVAVPNVVGNDKLDAMSALEALKLTVKVVEQQSADAPEATVLSQTPAAGAKVKPGTTVTIVVATSGTGSNQIPVASFDGPATGRSGEKLSFSAKSSTDDGKIVRYYWEFGDGATSSKESASHTWSAPGTFEITLWVTDDTGAQASTTKRVTIR